MEKSEEYLGLLMTEMFKENAYLAGIWARSTIVWKVMDPSGFKLQPDLII